MKKTILLIGLFAVTTVALFAQTLPRLAVVAFSTNMNTQKTNADAITVRNLVESHMVGTGRYEIITRDDIDKLLENQRIQVSSISSAENVKKLELQNISYIVTGSLDAMGDDYAVTVRVLNVSTGQFSHSENDFMGSGSRDLYNGINSLMTKFVVGMSSVGDGGSRTLPRLAVVAFNTNVSNEKVNADVATVRNLVESQMVGTRKLEIITRDDIDKLLENQRIQVSSISSAENLRKLQLQNISYIVTGSLDAMGDDYAITVRMLDVSTGQFTLSDNDFMGGGSNDLYNGITGLMTNFVSRMIFDGDRIRQANVGEYGPAGGIIFYDKGVFSNGWRFLEAAPAETEFTAEWGAYFITESGFPSDRYHGEDVHTGTAVGSGKNNTLLIMRKNHELRESGRAAQLCASINFGGYRDWFLPSKDELDLMYRNLKQKGLGGFGNSNYWSSSQYSTYFAWYQHFGSGGWHYLGKRYTYSVRAVRAF